MKTCSKCKVPQGLDQFSKDNSRKDGLNPWCRRCKTEASAVYRIKHHDKRLAYERDWEIKNKEKRSHQKAVNEKTCKTRIYRRNWRQENLGKVKAYCRKYQATKLQRTPKWLTKAHLQEIEQFYTDATYLTFLTQIPFEVDHRVPLQGRLISGLHVPWNLQILTESENCKKGNR